VSPGTTEGGTSYTASDPPTEAGSYSLKLSVPVSNTSYAGEATFDFTIEKRVITITAVDVNAAVGDAVGDYKYTPSPVPSAAVGTTTVGNNYITGDVPLGGTGVNAVKVEMGTGVSTAAGKYSSTGEAELEPSLAGAAGAGADNYELVFVKGKLKVFAAKYTVKVTSQSAKGATGGGTYIPGETVAINAGEREYYVFSGWTASVAGVKFANASSAKTTFEMPEGNVEVTAKWADEDDVVCSACAIAFNAGGGTVTPASGTTNSAGRLTTLPVPVREGFGFDGWFTAATSGNEVTTSTVFYQSWGRTIYAQWTAEDSTVSVASRDRVVPEVIDGIGVVVTPNASLPGEFTAGPNPVAKNAGEVKFFRQGKSVGTATLSVYDVKGTVVAKVKVSDKALGTSARREVGSWNLKDSKGNPVAEGTYLVRGKVKTSDGKAEKVSLILGVK
jgi:uncharacterized repeat protein (TIGR02543 family)